MEKILPRLVWWRAAWRVLWRATSFVLDRFPPTPLGLAVALGSAGALWWYGIARIDLLLLVVGGVGLGLSALSSLVVGLSALGLWWTRRAPIPRDPLRVECGAATRTDFSLPALWFVPLLGLRWRWETPRAEVRPLRDGGRLREEVRALRRGVYNEVARRVEVFDLLGLARVRFSLREPRQVRVHPSAGALRRVDVLQSTARGEELSHPSGAPEGDRIDMRRYAPGDPIRFVMWKAFAKSRTLMVRTPEKAISPARQTAAYLVTGAHDEPAAGALRAAMEAGSLGREWVLGADSVRDYARALPEALEVLTLSGAASEDEGGAGLARFLSTATPGGGARAVIFVPARVGPWLERVAGLVQAQGAQSFEFFVCADGALADERRGFWSRVALLPPSAPSAYAAPLSEVRRVVKALRATRSQVRLVDRVRGQVSAGAQLAALLKSSKEDA